MSGVEMVERTPEPASASHPLRPPHLASYCIRCNTYCNVCVVL